MALTLTFADTGGGDESGFNDPIVSSFNDRGARVFLVREAIQNALDARQSGELPVEVRFELEHVPIDEIPLVNEYRDHFTACKDYYPSEGHVAGFFDRAIALTKRKSIAFLKISDYNTVGLDLERAKALFGSVGQSLKSIGSGGSYGLGKGPLFACSHWRTVFASSVFLEDDRTPRSLFKGKSRITSHRYGGTVKQGNGSLGLSDQSPVTKFELIPNFFRRPENEVGTDLWIAAYDEGDNINWKKSLLRPVLEFFWLSISEGKLIVSVGSTIVDVQTISNVLEEYYPRLNTSSRTEPRQFFDTFAGVNRGLPDHYQFKERLPVLGDVNLFLRLRDGDNSTVSFHRTPLMTVYTSRLERGQDYTAVFLNTDDVGNEFLRRCEDPTHAEWKDRNYVSLMPLGPESEHLSGDQVKDALRSINSFIGTCIKNARGQEVKDVLDVHQLRDLLPLDPDAGRYGGSIVVPSPTTAGKEPIPTTNVTSSSKKRDKVNRTAIAYSKPHQRGASSADGGFVPIHKQRKPIKQPGRRMKADDDGAVDVPQTESLERVLIRHIVVDISAEGTTINLIVTCGIDMVVDILPMKCGESAGSEERLILKWARTSEGNSFKIVNGVIYDVSVLGHSPLVISVLSVSPLQSTSISFLIRRGLRA